MALLYLVFLFLVIATLLVGGLKMYGSIVTRGKINDTRDGQENQVRMIVAWAEKNGRLPATLAEYLGVFGGTPPLDAWGRPLAYVYDTTLAGTATGGLCGRTSTVLQDSGTSIAFALVSGGSDFGILTTVNGTVVTTPLYAVTGAFPQTLANYQSDLYRPVPLEELKNRAGCYGPTGGRLAILNNELPRVCAGAAYTATVFATGGVPLYKWCTVGAFPPGITPTVAIPDCSAGFSANAYPSIQLAGNAPGTAAAYPITFRVQDNQTPTPNVVERIYTINVMSGGACGGGSNPTGDALHNGADAGINTTPPAGGGTSADATALSQNIVTGMSGIQVVNGIIDFGFNQGNGSACVWYPYNFPLLGKTLRAYWNFCFNNSDTSSNSTSYADGYTFTLMQGSNPTTYCGTGTPWDAVTNPYFDCQYSGHFGEFLAYCGLPGQSKALEFDIYPNSGILTRNDPIGNYNHVAVVNAISEHNGPSLAGLYGENTHNFGGNPACGTTSPPQCNGTCTGANACTGTCDGVNVTNKTCNGTCYGTCTGTCNGTGSGCVYNGFNGDTFTIPSGHTAVTWLEDGCNATKDNHNARVEIHTRCNADCSQCETSGCTTKSLIKVWLDKGNDNLGSNEASAPDLSYCADLPTALNQFKVGFTQATGAMNQMGYISNFMLKSYGICPVPVITPSTLPIGSVGTPYAAQVSATGGTAPYTWSLSSSNITQNGSLLAATKLPPGLNTTLLTSGTCPGTTTPTCTNSSPCICGTPTATGTYNTVLVSATDSCSADTCANTASRSYSINICSALSITTASPLPTGTVGTAYLTNLTQSGGTAPYTWSLLSGSLAPGLSLNSSTGAIGGTPSIAGTYTFTIGLADSCGSGNTAQQTYTMTITACSGYRVWNATGNTYDFSVSGSCSNNVNNGSEITSSTTLLQPGGTISRYTSSQGHCNKNIGGQITYSQAVAADTNGNCQLNYNANDTLSDR